MKIHLFATGLSKQQGSEVRGNGDVLIYKWGYVAFRVVFRSKSRALIRSLKFKRLLTMQLFSATSNGMWRDIEDIQGDKGYFVIRASHYLLPPLILFATVTAHQMCTQWMHDVNVQYLAFEHSFSNKTLVKMVIKHSKYYENFARLLPSLNFGTAHVMCVWITWQRAIKHITPINILQHTRRGSKNLPELMASTIGLWDLTDPECFMRWE